MSSAQDGNKKSATHGGLRSFCLQRRKKSGDLEDDLAEMLVLFHHPVGVDDLVDREDLFDDRHDAAVGKFREGGPGELGDDLAFVRDRPGAQDRADDLLALDHHQGEVEFGLDAADDADTDQAPGIAEGVHVRRQILGADVVEDDIDPLLGGELLDRLGEVGGGGEVDDQIDAERLDPLDLARMGGDDDLAVGGQGLARAESPRC